jgi:RecB family endonuclease NucS
MKSSETIKFLEREGKKVLYAANKQEELFVTLNEVLWDVTKEFPEDKAEKIVEGTENLLQKDLLENISKYIPGTKGICREYETGKGPVDICCYDPTRNKIILVEVKRTAGSNAVYQVMKYKAGIQNMYEKHKNLGTTKLEAKQKGQHDTSGTTIPLSAFKEPEYYLAARHFTSSAKREALENNVRMITVEE